MPTKKSTRRSGFRKKRSQSQSGKILPPLDVNSPSTLKDLQTLIKKGPITIMMIYADWCGHCHEIMPHWDEAVNTPNRSIQAVKVNEKMLDRVNTAVNRGINRSAAPIAVQGYPSIILVNNQGNKVTDVNPVKDTEALSNAMNYVGPVAEEAEIEASIVPNSVNSMNANAMNANAMNAMNASMNANSRNASMNINPSMEPVSPSLQEQPTSLYAENPPSIKGSNELTPYNKLRGGSSLYASLSQTSYTLAPAAALLGMAAYVMQRRDKSKKSNKGKKSKTSNKGKKGKKGRTLKRK